MHDLLVPTPEEVSAPLTQYPRRQAEFFPFYEKYGEGGCAGIRILLLTSPHTALPSLIVAHAGGDQLGTSYNLAVVSWCDQKMPPKLLREV